MEQKHSLRAWGGDPEDDSDHHLGNVWWGSSAFHCVVYTVAAKDAVSVQLAESAKSPGDDTIYAVSAKKLTSHQ